VGHGEGKNVKNLHSLEELQENIRHKISAIPLQELRHVSETHSHDVGHAYE
jgi:hypothetical protein